MSDPPRPIDPAAFRVEARARAADDWQLVSTHSSRQAAIDAAAASIQSEPFTEARVVQLGREVGHWQGHGLEALAPGVTLEQVAELFANLPTATEEAEEP